MRKTLQAKYIASEIHAFLFISMWILYSIFSQPIADGPSAALFVILLIADLPLSLVAFGVMFTSSEMGTVAAVLWGFLGTLWWFLIGLAIDAGIRRYRNRRILEATPAIPTADPGANACRLKELLIAMGVVAVVIVASLGWQWNGVQGHFEKGQIGNLAFAPDGRSIVLVRTLGDTSTIESVILASGTSDPIRKALPCTAYSPNYSPDGKLIAFACESKPDDHSRIFV